MTERSVFSWRGAAWVLMGGMALVPEPSRWPVQRAADTEYRATVIAYRTNPNPAIERMLAMAERDLGEALSAATGSNGWAPGDLLTAAMLHTDAALYLLVHADRSARTQLGHADDLIAAALQRSPAHEWFDRDWLPIVSKALVDNDKAMWALALSDRRTTGGLMTASNRRGARAAFTRGIEMERLADAAGPAEGLGGIDVRTFVAPAAAFALALERDPEMLDAALHFGRIEMLAHRDERAGALLARAASSTRPSTAYLARLFAGSIDERQGRFAEAEAQYRRAAGAFPRGQAATLALAELLARTGRVPEATRGIDDLLDRGARGAVVEPWWMYGQRADVPDIRCLREDVSR